STRRRGQPQGQRFPGDRPRGPGRERRRQEQVLVASCQLEKIQPSPTGNWELTTGNETKRGILVGILIGILKCLIVGGSLFMVCIILIQRGKGGGLAGAFGGVGGSSAFGTKAGDVFTKITIGIAVGWILVAMLLVVLTNRRTESAWGSDSTSLTKEL